MWSKQIYFTTVKMSRIFKKQQRFSKWSFIYSNIKYIFVY